jgi:hypothetical protein
VTQGKKGNISLSGWQNAQKRFVTSSAFVVPGNVGYNPYEFEKARLDSAENLV